MADATPGTGELAAAGGLHRMQYERGAASESCPALEHRVERGRRGKKEDKVFYTWDSPVILST